MYYLMLFCMSRGEFTNRVQYSDEASLHQAAGSLLLALADCSLFAWISCQDTILFSAIIMSYLG